MSFRSVFLAVVIAFGLIIAAFLVNRARPQVQVEQPTAAMVEASGKCAECHARTQYSIVHEYEMSDHAKHGVTCLDCHQPAKGQKSIDHHGFVISAQMTSGNCRSCHENAYRQFLESGHAAPAWSAVHGKHGLSPEEIAFSEKHDPGGIANAPNPLALPEGHVAVTGGCNQCHSIGKPNSDGTIGSCIDCHSPHAASISLARMPSTCGQCHMGPDHSQMEIYTESKHGVMFAAYHNQLKMSVAPAKLTTRDMWIPTCATCHMSGLNGIGYTHNVTARLSWYLAAPITTRRPDYVTAQSRMKQVCSQCHTRATIDRVYKQAEEQVAVTNSRVQAAQQVMNGLQKQGLLAGPPFTHAIEFTYFNMWHYDARTSKHGAFMGGADFVQWHGNYELLHATMELKHEAAALRREHGLR
jgi:hypothetical protein